MWVGLTHLHTDYVVLVDMHSVRIQDLIINLQTSLRCALQTTATPPFAAVVDAATDSLLLALDPEGPVPTPSSENLAAVSGAGAATEEATAIVEDVQEVDVNPRSLQQAVEALAKFTSDEPAPGGAPALGQSCRSFSSSNAFSRAESKCICGGSI